MNKHRLAFLELLLEQKSKIVKVLGMGIHRDGEGNGDWEQMKYLRNLECILKDLKNIHTGFIRMWERILNFLLQF